jgi:GNAT superfamily N-acetyltransferase
MELARPAGPGDRQVCTRLLAQALVSAATMRGGAVLIGDATPAGLLERWTRPGGTAHLLVGEYAGAVVGLLGVTTALPAAGGGAGGGHAGSSLIECCYVETGARGVGVGTALMEAAVEWCTAQGCPDVDALALPGDRTTKQRLEAAGFTARLLTLSRRLG